QLVLANPNSTPANATVTFQLAAGAPVVQPVPIGANGRATVKVDDFVGNAEVSSKVDSNKPLVVERSMYFKYGPLGWTGGHTAHGAAAPATDWFLAEGYTAPNFDCFILVQNPGTAPVNVTISLLKQGGGGVDLPLTVAARARRNFGLV